MDRRARVALLAALVALPGFVPSVEASGSEVRWEYVLDFSDADTGRVRATLTLHGAKGALTTVCFDTRGLEYPVSDVSGDRVRSGVCPDRTPAEGLHQMDVESDAETLRYSVDVKRLAPGKRDEYASFLDATGGLVKAEAFALKYEYKFFCRVPLQPDGSCPPSGRPVFSATVRFVLPDGWSVETPWERLGDGTYALPPREALPRGFLAVGGLRSVSQTVDGREYRYARLGAAPEAYSETELFRYLAGATPFYRSVYGDVVGPVVLVISWGDPMFKGGLAGRDSLYVHREADIRTLAHEYAHVWQDFLSGSAANDATIWINEGDAEYHGTLSLLATGEWSLEQVNEFLGRADEARRDVREPLVRGVYGHDDAVAYKKGLVMMAWLDDAIREHTDGARGLADLLKALNVLFEPSPEGRRRVESLTNAEVLATLNALVERDFREVWDAYVLGPEWPPLVPVRADERLALVAVEFHPAHPTPGEEVVARIVAENRGVTDVRRSFVVTLAGEDLGEIELDLPVTRRSADAVLRFPAPDAGEHAFKVGWLTETLKVLRPAEFSIDRISVVPARPRAAEPASVLVYVLNAGEAAAATRVRLALDGVVLGDRTFSVPGLQEAAATFEVRFPLPGAARLRADLVDAWSTGSATLDLDVLTAVAPSDGEAPVPAVGWLAVLAAAAVGLFARRRGR